MDSLHRPPLLRTRWLDVAGDVLFVYPWALAAGIVCGIGFGWPAGLLAGCGFAGVLYAVGRLAKALVHKSRQTKVPQRPFPASTGARRADAVTAPGRVRAADAADRDGRADPR